MIKLAVEGVQDETAMRRLFAELGVTVSEVHGRNGKQHLLARLNGYNYAARYEPWVVVADLDCEFACPAEARRLWLPAPSLNMHFRIAVQEIEAWLLADRERIASFLGVSRDLLPLEPDSVPDPKQTMVNLARRSRFRTIREDMVPIEGLQQVVGPAYTSRMIEFISSVDSGWRPRVAAQISPSLARTIERIEGAFC